MDRIKRLSFEVLDTHKSKFGEDFADNKKVLDQVSIVRSKGLKNEVAGFITKFIKKEIREEKSKQAQIRISKSEDSEIEDSVTEESSTEIISEIISNDDAPAVETPAVETPAVETPAVETPAVETPAVETPAENTEEKTE